MRGLRHDDPQARSSAVAAPTSACAASRCRGSAARRARAAQPGGEQLGEAPGAVGARAARSKPPTSSLADDDLRERHHPCARCELGATVGVLREVDLVELEPALAEQRLRLAAVAARLGGIDRDLVHYFTMYSMSGPLKTDAIVLRSLRYGEADRILHLYTPARGRIGAIAKGVRRTRSRFGGRLEPFSRVRLVCHEGRGELLTITAVETLDAHARLRDHAATLDSAARACDAVARVFETEEPHPAVYNLLANELALLAADADARDPRQRARVPPQAARRGRPRAGARRVRVVRRARAPRRLLAAGGRRRLQRLRGGRRSRSPRETHEFMTAALASPLAQAPGRVAARAARSRARDRRDARAPRPPAPAPGGGCDDASPRRSRSACASARSASSRRSRRAPIRRCAPRPRRTAACARRSSATATGSSTRKAFRRLKHKTQVFVAPEGDHYRTRLTHTLEVTGISRTVARALALNEDLAEAIGLGHDLGHPPFGHIGEDVLDRCLRERFGGAFHHWEQSLRVVDALERDGARPEPDRAGPRRDPLPLRPRAGAGDARGRDRAHHRPLRLPQPRHRRRAARRRARRARRCRPRRSRCSATAARRGSTRSSTTSSSTRSAPGRSSRASAPPRRWSTLRDFMFEHVYLGAVARREHSKIETRRSAACSSTTARTPRRCRPPLTTCATPRHRLHRRDDRSLLHPRLPGARRAAGVRALMPRYTAESKERVRDAVDMVELVGARTELRRAGADSYVGRCPFHEERTPSFSVKPSTKVYYCFGCQAAGDAFTFVMETEGLDFTGGARVARRALRRHARARASRGPACRRAPPPPRAPARAARPHLPLLRARALGAPRGRARARVPRRPRPRGGGAARVPRRLRAERLGPRAARLAPQRLQRGGAARGGPRAALEPSARAASTTASAGASPSRCATSAAACSASARARWRRRSSGQVPQQRRRRGLPQGPPPVRHAPRARARREGRRGRALRGLHRRDRRPPGGRAQLRRPDGHGADRRAGRRSWRGSRRRSCSRSTPTAPGRRR